MSNYTFIEHPEQGLFAIDSDKLQPMNLADVYTEYGQRWGQYDAGDYIEILSEKCADFINTELEGWAVGDNFSAYDNSGLFDEILESDDLEEGVDYELVQTQVIGFTYWDGHNWRSIVLDCAEYPSQWEIIESEKLAEAEAIEQMEKINETAYGIDYRYGNYKISTSNFQGQQWYEYKIDLDFFQDEEN
jgi:hypothetical protein